MSRVTLNHLQKMKLSHQKITMLTVYDAAFTQLLCEEGVDIAFVGDSVGMAFQGNSSTIPVSLEQMVYHTQCVAKTNSRCFVLADLPFMSYHSTDIAMESARELMQVGAEMVKLEGGLWLCETIRIMAERGVAVCGHIGLMPQSIHVIGGYKVQGRTEEDARQLINQAIAIEQAGAKMLVVECIPRQLGKEISDILSIPVIGIGAGPDVDGQVLVIYDILGISSGKSMKFVKNFQEGGKTIREAIRDFVDAVKSAEFPSAEHCFT